MPFRTSCIGYVSSQMQSAHVLLEMQSAWGGTEISRQRERWRRGAEGALPINRLFEFLLRWACYVSISRGLFRPSARLLAAGGSHTFPSTAHCCLVPCRLSDVCVCVCVCVCVREREREIVFVWECERERECVCVCVWECVCVCLRECVCVCVFVWERESVCLCESVWERERESVCERERESVCVCVCACELVLRGWAKTSPESAASN